MYMYEDKVEFSNNNQSGGGGEAADDNDNQPKMIKAGIPLDNTNMNCYHVPLGIYCSGTSYSESSYIVEEKEPDPEKISVISDAKLETLLGLVSVRRKPKSKSKQENSKKSQKTKKVIKHKSSQKQTKRKNKKSKV